MNRERISEKMLRRLIDQTLHEQSGHHIVPPTIVRVPGNTPNWHLAPDTPRWIIQAIEPFRARYDLADADGSQ